MTHKPTAVEATPDLSNVIIWLENGCDPMKAANELRIYQERIDAAFAAQPEESARCACCGLAYSSPAFADLVIDNEAWKAISPDGEGNGLLCPNCICARLHEKGLEHVRGTFRSGPLAVYSNPDPDGWVTVPREPTMAMLNAAVDVDSFKLGDIGPLGFRISPQRLFEKCYRAMLSSAPAAPGQLPSAPAKEPRHD